MIPDGNLLFFNHFRWYRFAQPPAIERLSLTGNPSTLDNLSLCNITGGFGHLDEMEMYGHKKS